MKNVCPPNNMFNRTLRVRHEFQMVVVRELIAFIEICRKARIPG